MNEIITVHNARCYMDAVGSFLFGERWKPTPPLPPKLACVYAFEMSDGTTKIGVTRNITKRIASVEGAVYLKVTRVYHTKFAPFADMRSVEASCHKAFSNRRVRGEYFQITFEEACSELDKHTSRIANALKAADEKFLKEIALYEKIMEDYKSGQDNRPDPANGKPRITKVSDAILDIGKTAEILESTLGIKRSLALSVAIDIVEAIDSVEVSPLKDLISDSLE